MEEKQVTNELEQDGIIEKPGGYISKIQLNNDESIDIMENDIVVFVGPNNTGKSQALKDIYEISKDKIPSIVIKDIEITKRASNFERLLDTIASVDDKGSYKQYMGLDFNFNSHNFPGYEQAKYYGVLRPLFVIHLSTLNRLTISNPPNNIRRDATKQHPIHYTAFDGKYRRWLSENFKKAFGEDLNPHTQYGATIPLCIGDTIKFEREFQSEQERQEEYAKILDKYTQVQNQGDGIKSFTGILLYLMLDYYCTFLIDEPESFLHPPQANIMGRIIGETLTDQQQAFISTHSEEIIKGLLAVCPNRVKVIRITREGDTNKFSILDNEKFNEVWNDPLLKYSNIMSSLFHKSVVLCESDSDCKMYSIVENHLKVSGGQYSETFFIHCGGKQRMAKIAGALRALDIEVKLIPDIDVMNDENIFRDIIEAFGIEWNSINRDYNIVVSNLHSPKESINRNDFITTVDRILGTSTNQDLTKKEMKDINEALRIISKWTPLKESGVVAIPRGDATGAFGRMDKILREHGINIVPVGELECFIKDVGGHGPGWTNKVLETYPDLDDVIYKKIKEFISSLGL